LIFDRSFEDPDTSANISNGLDPLGHGFQVIPSKEPEDTGKKSVCLHCVQSRFQPSCLI
jgi:hypothetical protein